MSINTPLRDKKRLDADFENFLEGILQEVDDSEFTPEKRAQRKLQTATDDLLFAKVYFPQIFELPFNDLHRHIAGLRTGRFTVSGHRESGKTAFTFVTKVIAPLCRQIGGIINISLRNLDMAERRTEAIRNLMMRNRLLVYDYDLEAKLTKDNVGYYIFGNTTLLATSYKTGLRGNVTEDFKRFRISIQDDLYNRTTVSSAIDNERVMNFVNAEVYGQLERSGLSITLGNSITENCPIMLLRKEHPENHFRFPALDDTGESNWPEYRTAEEWAAYSLTIPVDIWSGDYMDEPYETGDIFTKDDFHTININTIKLIASITAIDPSIGSSPQACDKGIITGGITESGTVIITDIYIRKNPYEQVFAYLQQIHHNTPNHRAFLFENDFNQWGFAEPYYLDWLKHNQPLPIIRFHSKNMITDERGADKTSRIMTLVFPHQTGKLVYDDALTGRNDYQKLLHQALAFGKAKEKLDGLDALATLFLMINSYAQSGGFKQLRSRQYQKRLFR
jgi:hypothetical protein